MKCRLLMNPPVLFSFTSSSVRLTGMMPRVESVCAAVWRSGASMVPEVSPAAL